VVGIGGIGFLGSTPATEPGGRIMFSNDRSEDETIRRLLLAADEAEREREKLHREIEEVERRREAAILERDAAVAAYEAATGHGRQKAEARAERAVAVLQEAREGYRRLTDKWGPVNGRAKSIRGEVTARLYLEGQIGEAPLVQDVLGR
jgi:hypothetical protein